MTNLTNQMRTLEVEISRQQKYIAKHGSKNDSLDYDKQWEQYKKDAQYNLDKWDSLRVFSDDCKLHEFKIKDKFKGSMWHNEFPNPDLKIK